MILMLFSPVTCYCKLVISWKVKVLKLSYILLKTFTNFLQEYHHYVFFNVNIQYDYLSDLRVYDMSVSGKRMFFIGFSMF